MTVVAVEPAMESRSAVSISKSSEELESLGERGRVLTLSIAARSIPEVRSDRAEDAIRCAEEATGAAVNVPNLKKTICRCRQMSSCWSQMRIERQIDETEAMIVVVFGSPQDYLQTPEACRSSYQE